MAKTNNLNLDLTEEDILFLEWRKKINGAGKTTDEFSNAQRIDAWAGEVNKKISDLQTAGFITKVVSDLVNYYTKEETYTKEEVSSLISDLLKRRFQKVSALPTSDIDTATIYLLPAANAALNNIYTEYIYTSTGWEVIGSTAIDISGKADLDSDGKLKRSQLPSISYSSLTDKPRETVFKRTLDLQGDSFRISPSVSFPEVADVLKQGMSPSLLLYFDEVGQDETDGTFIYNYHCTAKFNAYDSVNKAYKFLLDGAMFAEILGVDKSIEIEAAVGKSLKDYDIWINVGVSSLDFQWEKKAIAGELAKKADLGSNGRLPASQLPSISYSSLTDKPVQLFVVNCNVDSSTNSISIQGQAFSYYDVYNTLSNNIQPCLLMILSGVDFTYDQNTTPFFCVAQMQTYSHNDGGFRFVASGEELARLIEDESSEDLSGIEETLGVSLSNCMIEFLVGKSGTEISLKSNPPKEVFVDYWATLDGDTVVFPKGQLIVGLDGLGDPFMGVDNGLGNVTLLSVGDGENTYYSLPPVAAYAVDVPKWAKEAEKPTYTKEEVGLGEVVNAGMDQTPTANSNKYVTSKGVKDYVDNAIAGLATGGGLPTFTKVSGGVVLTEPGVYMIVGMATKTLTVNGTSNDSTIGYAFIDITNGGFNVYTDHSGQARQYNGSWGGYGGVNISWGGATFEYSKIIER